MTYSFEPSDESNTIVCDEDGLSLVSAPGCRALIGIRDLPYDDLIGLWQEFREELRLELASIYGKTRAEFNEWHVYSEKHDLVAGVLKDESCVGFKSFATGLPKLHWFRQSAVASALIDLGLIPAVTPHGKPRQNVSRGLGGAPALCQALPLDEQRRVIDRMFDNPYKPLDEIIRIDQTSLFDLESIEGMLRGAWDSTTALNRLAAALYAFDMDQKVASEKSNRSGDGRLYAAPWFCAYLARKGYVLLPRLSNAEFLTPRALKPLLWTFLVPPQSRDLARHLVKSSGPVDWHYTWPALRELILYTNLFHSQNFKLEHLLQLKAEYTVADTGRPLRASATQLGHGLNRLFEAYISFHGKAWEDLRQEARYFGGGRRIVTDHGRDAFGWVDNPKAHRLSQYRELLGEPPESFPPTIRAWASELRAILPDFGVATPTGKIVSLNLWLIYIIKMGEKAPSDWKSIDRAKHINHVGLGTEETFVDFLRGLDRGNKMIVIADLKNAWHLASLRDGFASRLSCPIDTRMDNPGGEAPRNSGRTRRKSIPEDVYEILVEENRRDDFAFARSMIFQGTGMRAGEKIHWRKIGNFESGTTEEVFWPAMPMALDLSLRMGMRSSSALWLDSGEGDENWVDRDTLELIANPLATRSVGRSTGFLRVFQVGPAEKDKVLGMYLEVNKTDPYGVAWVDQDSARYYERMRDWQARFNRMDAPIPAERSDLNLAYAGVGTVPMVYPVFRDPDSRSAHPPTPQTLNNYWTALLQYCESIVEQRLGRRELLLIHGKPRWDLHSLRVTTVTVLLNNNVPPWIVAELVGHHSLAMVWHYKDVNHRDTHQALQKAHEGIRRKAIEAVQKLLVDDFDGTEEEWHDKLKRILGGLVNFRVDNIGPALLRVARSEGANYETFSHGLCPGGDCNEGGREYKNAHQPVFRPRACSRCRYRITGPAFLAGLVHRCNSLMIEIKSSMDKEADLNADIEKFEDEGKASDGRTLVLRGLVARQREFRDELWAEWCAEMSTIKKSEDLMDNAEEGTRLPVLAGAATSMAKTRLDTVHELSMLHTVLSEGNVILGASLEIPDGLKERRDALLIEIARNNDHAAWLYHMAPRHRRLALDAYGELLLDHIGKPGDIQRLIEGQLKLDDRPALAIAIQQMIKHGWGEDDMLSTSQPPGHSRMTQQ